MVVLLTVLQDDGVTHHQIDVDADPLVQSDPEHPGQVEEQRLDHQDQRDPLVVGDHVAFVVLVLFRDVLVPREVVGVPHPAVAVRVVLVVAGEVRRDPARDRVADQLLGADQDRGHDQDADRDPVR